MITNDRELNRFEIEFNESYEVGQGLEYINKLLQEFDIEEDIEVKEAC